MPSSSGRAQCRGRLYLVKHYPGPGRLADDAADIVHGELFRLRDARACCASSTCTRPAARGFPPPTEYVREMLAVTRADGPAGRAWTYLYNWPVDRAAAGSRQENSSSD